MRGVTDLKTHLESLRNEYVKVSDLPNQIEKKEREKEHISYVIKEKLSDVLCGKTINGEWEQVFQEIKTHQKGIKQQKAELEQDRARLGIEEDEYRSEPAEEVYDREELEKLRKRREILKRILIKLSKT